MEQGPTACRGVRGAIGVDGVTVEEATRELLDALVQANGLRPQDVAAAIFTLTDDLAGENPAAAARRHGWSSVPLLVVKESGDARLERCLRVLVLWNTSVPQDRVRHVYLGRAAALRPDLVGG
ncbi:MAG TPA: chorismate mutase [Actinomycetota bacterium]|nr:chorismate mutase [Actinomycetota bacterium]